MQNPTELDLATLEVRRTARAVGQAQLAYWAAQLEMMDADDAQVADEEMAAHYECVLNRISDLQQALSDQWSARLTRQRLVGGQVVAAGVEPEPPIRLYDDAEVDWTRQRSTSLLEDIYQGHHAETAAGDPGRAGAQNDRDADLVSKLCGPAGHPRRQQRRSAAPRRPDPGRRSR